jgi:biotin carboxylase
MSVRMGRDRVVLVMHTTAYGAEAFVVAARRVGVEVVIASDRCPVLDHQFQWPADSWVIDFYDPPGAAAVIAGLAAAQPEAPVRAVIAVGGEVPSLVAALAARRLGLPGNAPGAVAAAGNKLRLRQLCAAAVHAPVVPRFVTVPIDETPQRVVAAAQAGAIGWPCVIKPLLLSASRGVMRADDPTTLARAFERLRRILRAPELLEMDPVAARLVLIESFVPGPEVALEGLLFGGALHTLALFDKPDPLDGPFFEETIYVTPSRLPAQRQQAIEAAVLSAAHAIGLATGPIHAELRLGAATPVVIDLAARPIGGLCSRALRFVRDRPLEELVIRQALGQDVRDLTRERCASGVMMIPIPRGGILKRVAGIDAARDVAGIDDVVIAVRPGETLVPLPEGASYLGFIFARGEAPAVVEAALREAHRRLSFEIAPRLPVERAPVERPPSSNH